MAWTAPPLLLLLAAAVPSEGVVRYHNSTPVVGTRWKLLEALADKPAGAYHRLILPIVDAVRASYVSMSGPDFEEANATIRPDHAAGGNWYRVAQLDQDPARSGIHVATFADESSRRAIVAFRGSCMTMTRQCRADMCVIEGFKTFGRMSDIAFRPRFANRCGEFSKEELDYIAQAEAYVRRVQAEFPGFALLLTGHSMGGFLATVTAAKQPGVLQAVTFAPSPFHKALTDYLHFTEEEIRALPEEDLVSVCDAYDCGINTMYVPLARLGSETCLFKDMPETLSCRVYHTQADAGQARVLRTASGMKCKSESHNWKRYETLVPIKGKSGAPRYLPQCSEQYSELSGLDQRFNAENKTNPAVQVVRRLRKVASRLVR